MQRKREKQKTKIIIKEIRVSLPWSKALVQSSGHTLSTSIPVWLVSLPYPLGLAVRALPFLDLHPPSWGLRSCPDTELTHCLTSSWPSQTHSACMCISPYFPAALYPTCSTLLLSVASVSENTQCTNAFVYLMSLQLPHSGRHIPILLPSVVALNQAQFSPQSNVRQCVETFWVDATWKERRCYQCFLVGTCYQTFYNSQESPHPTMKN